MTTCKWTSRETPRIIPNRHTEDCADRYGDDPHGCAGCLPCTDDHCRVDGHTHVKGIAACAECVAEFRANLHEIAQRFDALPDEALHRGINGEAMVLLGPVANPEARGHLEASVLAGRIERAAIEMSHLKNCKDGKCLGCEGQLHPEWVLGQIEDTWREALDHDPPKELFSLRATVDYLDRTLTYMATWPHLSFEHDASTLRRCAGHIEAVLHDQESGVLANVRCFECGDDLERRLGKNGFDDHWTCKNTRCPRRTYTIAEFNFALRAELERAQEGKSA